MLKEYIKKPIETDSGFEAECWEITGIWIDLKQNCGVITLEGYKDFDAKESDKAVMGTQQVTIVELEQMDCYDAVRAELLSTVIAAETFTGATLEQVETE